MVIDGLAHHLAAAAAVHVDIAVIALLVGEGGVAVNDGEDLVGAGRVRGRLGLLRRRLSRLRRRLGRGLPLPGLLHVLLAAAELRRAAPRVRLATAYDILQHPMEAAQRVLRREGLAASLAGHAGKLRFDGLARARLRFGRAEVRVHADPGLLGGLDGAGGRRDIRDILVVVFVSALERLVA